MSNPSFSTPCYIVDKDKLRKNLEILKSIHDETGAHILLAQKAFSLYALYPFMGEYLSGTTASGLYEARLGYEEMPGKEVHVFHPAYQTKDMPALMAMCDHMVFNSFEQWEHYRNQVLDWNTTVSHHKNRTPVSPGLRINPLYSEVDTPLYDPCAPYSRLGITPDKFSSANLTGIEGLHFHTMCEQGAETLERTLDAVISHFDSYLRLPQITWVNFGGGHHITKKNYNRTLLCKLIKKMQDTYHVEVYLEPGEAVALNAGTLEASVLTLIENEKHIAILDTSAACHMPDVLEMPYRPHIKGSGKPGEYPYTYRLGGPTCLAGDMIGEYSFKKPLEIGERLTFTDMAIYTMVKNNTFNGMPLPSIFIKEKNRLTLHKEFGYKDFKCRL